MSQYFFSYEDFNTPGDFIRSSSKHMKNYTSNHPLSTTRSLSGTAGYMSSYTLSDILQGKALYRPKEFVLQSQQDALTTNFRNFLIDEGDNVELSGGTLSVTPGLGVGGATLLGGHSNSVDLQRSSVITFAPIHPNDVDTYAGINSSEAFAPADFVGDVNYENGRIPLAVLAPLANQPNHRLWHVAAQAFNQMREELIAVGFTDPFVRSSYRSFEAQELILYDENKNNIIDAGVEGPNVPGSYRNPKAAGTPGKSKHGWGIAIDFHKHFRDDSTDINGKTGFEWLNANAHRYGFVHPTWARPGGSNPEPWHWEYRAHVTTG